MIRDLITRRSLARKSRTIDAELLSICEHAHVTEVEAARERAFRLRLSAMSTDVLLQPVLDAVESAR